MASLPAANSFDGGSAGSAVTAANSGGASGTAFDVAAGTSTAWGTYDTAQSMRGGMSAVWNYTGAANIATFSYTGLNVATLYGRLYLRLGSIPNFTHRLLLWTDTAAAASARMRVETSGKIQFADSSNGQIAATLSTTALTLNTWYRIEWTVTTGLTTGSCQWWLYTGHSVIPIETLSATNQAFTANNFDKIDFGSQSGPTTYQFWLDEVQVNIDGPPGPVDQYLLRPSWLS